MFFQIIIFLSSILVISILSGRLVKTLIEIAKYLKWREFIISFFVMGITASLPNLFVDLPAALQGLAPLALGDIIGGNLLDLTLVAAVVMFFSSKKSIPVTGTMMQGSAVFTFFIAILPVFLIWDGKLTRLEGIILISAFIFYVFWLFSKDSRYRKIYKEHKAIKAKPIKSFKAFLKNVAQLIALVAILLFAAQGVITSAEYFSISLGLSLSLVGIFIVALANCFPETYFGIISVRNGQKSMVIGDIMGSVITSATLVLGIIGLVSPFEIKDMSPFLTARIFTIAAAMFFLVALKTGRKFTKKEALFLLFVYIAFLLSEIFLQYAA